MHLRQGFAVLGAVALAVAGFVLDAAPTAAATTFVVTSTSDVAGACNPGSCTLRAAVAAANTTAGDDTITFSVNGTFALSLGELVVNDPGGGALTIQGNGTANTIIDGQNTSRVLDDTGFHTLTLRNLTVAHGTSGAGAVNGGGVLGSTITTVGTNFTANNSPNGSGGAIDGGAVTVSGGTFDHNQAAFAGGAIEALNGVVSGNAKFTANTSTGNRGGAIDFVNTLSVTDSTFGGIPASQGNTASVNGGAINTLSGTSLSLTRTIVINNSSNGPGGAIWTDANNIAITIDNSAVLGNSANGTGGGVELARTGGAGGSSLTVTNSVFQQNSSTSIGGAISLLTTGAGTLTGTITNSTFDLNTAAGAGGVLTTSGNVTATLRNITATRNTATSGSVLENGTGTMTLISSILSGNNNAYCAGTVTGGGTNLYFQDVGGSTCPAAGAITGQNPLLGTLAVSPPGFTATEALLPGSPAIDAVASGCPPPATDQRGVTRPQGSACDIGAYEVSAPVALVVTPRFTG